jgi:hypothetical protein
MGFLGKPSENQGFWHISSRFLWKTMWGMWINFEKFSPKVGVENQNRKRISHFGDLWKI